MVVGAVCVALVLGSAVSQSVEAASARRTINGKVLLSTPSTNYGDVAALCAWQDAGDASQGVIGWVVPLRPREATGSSRFALRIGDASLGLGGRVGLSFFGGSQCQTPRRLASFESEQLESPQASGAVPRGARYAVVTTISGVAVHSLCWTCSGPRGAVDVPFRLTVSPRARK